MSVNKIGRIMQETTVRYQCEFRRNEQISRKLFKFAYMKKESENNPINFRDIHVLHADSLSLFDQSDLLETFARAQALKAMHLFMDTNLIKGEGQRIALYKLAERANFEGVKQLLKLNLPKEVRSDVLYFAARNKNEEMLRLLVSCPEMDITIQAITLDSLIIEKQQDSVHHLLSSGIDEIAIEAVLCKCAMFDYREGIHMLLSSPRMNDAIQIGTLSYFVNEGNKTAVLLLANEGIDRLILAFVLQTAATQGNEHGIRMIQDTDILLNCPQLSSSSRD